MALQLLSLSLLFTTVLSLPAQEIISLAAVSEPSFVVSEATVRSAMFCPLSGDINLNNYQPVVFLVHGTGSTGKESWGLGPYTQLLPSQGFQVCWIDLPGRSLVDAQLSAEYVARGVQILSRISNQSINIIGHSQGAGLNPQWALQFWPSIRPMVKNYIALAGDFRGTVEGALLCNPVVGALLCDTAVWQQTVGSRYISAQNSPKAGSGASALVPTTSIYTIEDEVIQPEVGYPTSALPGSSYHALQDTNICGLTHVVDHIALVVDPAAYGLALTALQYGSPVNIDKFDKTYCLGIKDNTLFNPGNLVPLLQALQGELAMFGKAVPHEPLLQDYVCEQGFAPAGDCGARGFPYGTMYA